MQSEAMKKTIFYISLLFLVAYSGVQSLKCLHTEPNGRTKIYDNCNVCVKQVCVSFHYLCGIVCPISNNAYSCYQTKTCYGMGIGQCVFLSHYNSKLSTLAPTYCCYQDYCNTANSVHELKVPLFAILLFIFFDFYQRFLNFWNYTFRVTNSVPV